MEASMRNVWVTNVASLDRRIKVAKQHEHVLNVNVESKTSHMDLEKVVDVEKSFLVVDHHKNIALAY